MKVRCINVRKLPISEDSYLTLGEVYKVIKEDKRSYKIIANNGMQVLYNKERFEVIKEENKMEKTFREVIADIKEGEVWESVNKEIRCYLNGIKISHIEKGRCTSTMYMQSDCKYKLQRQQYTFEEAFKAYQEGKVIESCVTGDKYTWNGFADLICKNGSDGYHKLKSIYIEEIKGKWHINN